ncbi:MAG: beta-propeller repeat protein [Acidobacteriales bacterium]|nr:beta-propeller repeat protein [Terriglobales bacterium]
MHPLSVRNRPPLVAVFCMLLLLGGCSDFFVPLDALVSISIAPNNSTIQPGKTQQFTATGKLGDGTTRDVTSEATWTSSTPGTATITSAGLATAVAVGSTTITAASGGVTGTTTLTVSTQTVVSIAITPTNPTVNVGQTQQFTATATMSDNTTSDVTSTVVWSSSNPAIASVSAAGVATALTPGTTTITATSGSITNSTSLTVF